MVKAAERYVAFYQGNAFVGPHQASADLALLADYRIRWTCNFGTGEDQVQPNLAFHKFVYYILASEYAARALDCTLAFPNGAPDALLS